MPRSAFDLRSIAGNGTIASAINPHREAVMSRIALVTAVLVSVSACSRLPDAPEPQGESGPPQTNVIVIAPDGTRTKTAQPITTKQLAGEYRTFGTTGFILELNADETFKCEWRGCLGLYGTCTGKWSLDHDGIVPTTSAADGMFQEHPLAKLRIVSLQGHYLLVEEKYMGLFEEHGVGELYCFRQQPAEAAVNAEKLRWVEERVKKRLDVIGKEGNGP